MRRIRPTIHCSLSKHLLSLRTEALMAPLAEIRKSQVRTILAGFRWMVRAVQMDKVRIKITFY